MIYFEQRLVEVVPTSENSEYLKPSISHPFLRFNFLATAIFMVLLYGCGESNQAKKETPQQKNAHLVKMNPEDLSYEQLYDRALTLWDVPYEERKCATRYGKAHILVSGPEDAPPLVLLHGMNASSSMWYPNIGKFSKNHRVYAIDFLMEVNKSEMKGEMKDISEAIDWYNEVFDCLGLQQFEIVGASRGGWLATKIALEAPERIKKLVLLSPAQALIWTPPGLKLFENAMYHLNPEKEDLRDVLQTLSNDVDQIDQLYIDQYYRATTMEGKGGGIIDMTPFTNDDLAALSMPVLLLVGDNDFINNERSTKRAGKHIPNVKTEILKNSGHFLSIDRKKAVNRMVVDFLRE